MSPQPRLQECVRAFESQFAHVHRVLRRQGVPAADIEDLAQEVFIVMWRRWEEFDGNRALQPWLDGIAFNVVGSHLRRRREIPLADLDVVDPAPQGEDGLAAARAKRVVLRALERLPEAYRTVLALHDVDGVPMRRIAEAQGVPLFTAYTRLRKARRDFAAAVRAEVGRSSRRSLLPGFAVKAALPVAMAAAAAVWLVPARRPHPGAASPPAPPALGRGLRAYWPFDERAGAVARDRSGGGRDCILRTGDPTTAWRTGRLGGAVELHGRGFLECPQPAVAEAGAGELTVATWALVRSVPATGNRALVTRQLGDGSQDHFFLGFTNGRLIANSHTWNAVIFAPPLADGRWHHLAFTVSATRMTLYRDGQPLGSKPLRGRRRDPVDWPVFIGGGSNVPGVVHERFEGAVDETVLYDRALAPREVAALAAGAQP
jgi:RNA polymerase sigma factor (sigma-70 family)